jgi:hypothetical protein
MTATQNSKGGRMAAHVHPETYVATDPLDWRVPQLHTKRAQCELSMCTFQDYDQATQAEAIQQAKDLRAEMRQAASQPAEEPTPAVEEPTPTPRKSLPNAERRAEATHPEGGSAVTHGRCPSCGARKGQVCTSQRTGAPTNVVHAPRMRAWEAAGSPSLALPTPARKVAGVWVVVK